MLHGISLAQEEEGVVYRFDTLGKTKSVKMIGLPVVFSSPETDFGFGGGIRFQLVKDQDTLLRFDTGVGEDGNNGFYFGVNEAF